MKRIILSLMFFLLGTSLFAQDVRGSLQLGWTESLYRNELVYGASFTIDNLYLSGGTTIAPKYDYHSYLYANIGYLFDVDQCVSIGPVIGYGHQKGYAKDHNLFNYGVVLQGYYPIQRNKWVLLNIEATSHHTSIGIGFRMILDPNHKRRR